ncbi:hypothetical protein [Elizabethkingia ursingii]|uniref:hypothetical protein n=1 Tax=Elizabethkingia ursingii TaxID=1756150 RepID=UPI002012D2C8|nr:hypothetical protein [Elizabethkingia ursingii]MCL1671846.1 hypothetical protein [Elizabethkingia ursingii]
MNSGILIGGGVFIYYTIKYLSAPKLVFSKISKYGLWLIIIWLVLLILYSLSIGLASGSYDFQLSKNYISLLLIYWPGSIFLSKKISQEYSLEKGLNFIENVIFIQAIIVLIMLINPSFKSLIFSILKDGDMRELKNEINGGFRFLGFSYGTTWDLAFLQSLGLIVFSFRIRLFSKKIKFFDVVKYFLILFSGIISGRTVFIGIIFSLIILISPLKLSNFSFKKPIVLALKFLSIATFCFFIMGSLLPESIKKTVNENILPWAFEMFEQKSNGKYETSSSNELQKMYFEIPIQTLIFGDGYYVNPIDKDRYYMDTDAGYMRHILYYGLVGTSMLIFFYLAIFRRMGKCFKEFRYNLFVRFCVFLIMSYFFIGQIKGDLLSGADMPIKFLFILCMIFIFYDKKEEY